MSDADATSQTDSPITLRRYLTTMAPRLVREGSLYAAFVILFIVGCLVSEDFLTPDNQKAVLRQISENGIVAVGMTLVIITAGIDLSVGRMLGLASTLAAMLLTGRQWTAATWLALPAAMGVAGFLLALLAKTLLVKNRDDARARPVTIIAFLIGAAAVGAWTIPQVRSGLSIPAVVVVVPLAGLLLGSLSGLVIAKCRLQPFIVTLAMMTSAWGAARLIARSDGGGAYIHQAYEWDVPGLPALRKQVFNLLPVPGIFFLVCLLIGWFILSRLRFGRYIYAIGGNEETGRLSGINVDRVKIAVYAISGMLACLAGVLDCAQYQQGTPEAGAGGELDAIAAVVIGGTSLMGGRGRMIGTLVGVLIFGYLTNILQLCGVHTDVQLFITGAIIVLAVLLQEGFVERWIHRRRDRRAAS